jgi:TusA-related sulfurtransferase
MFLFLAYQVYCERIGMTNDTKPKKVLDCSGLCCSLPLVEARTELDKMKGGQTLEVIANCPSAEEDMNILTRLKGYELVRSWKEGDRFHFLIKKEWQFL